MDWKVYYDGGSTYSSEDGDITAAPGWGVLAIAYVDRATGRSVMRGFDYYYFMEGEWYGNDLTGLLDRLLNMNPDTGKRWPVDVVLAGRGVDDKSFQAAVHLALTDPDLPPKSGKNRRESPRRE